VDAIVLSHERKLIVEIDLRKDRNGVYDVSDGNFGWSPRGVWKPHP
jgi:uncharacterized protein YjiK